MKRRITIEIETDDDARRCGYCDLSHVDDFSRRVYCLAFQADVSMPDLERDADGLLLRCQECLVSDITDDACPDTERAP